MGLFQKERVERRFTVEGMTCQNCVKHVSEALASVRGVKDVQVDLDAGSATVAATDTADVDAMAKAVADAGYTATLTTG